MDPITKRRISEILRLYRENKRAEAAVVIRKLSRVQLAYLFVEDHHFPNGFLGDGAGRYNFQRFILRVLEGYDE